MPRLLTLPTLALAVLACHDTLTAPPTGLPVGVTSLYTQVAVSTITGAGDSVIAVVAAGVFSVRPCWVFRPDAGIDAGSLVVTFTLTEVDRPCPAYALVAPAPVRIAVHQVPPGNYDVRIVERLVPLKGDVSERQLARGMIALP
jgi:hypothetical protein